MKMSKMCNSQKNCVKTHNIKIDSKSITRSHQSCLEEEQIFFYLNKKGEETKSTFQLEKDSLIPKIVSRKPQRVRPITTEDRTNFESERLNCWTTNQTLPPHVL